MRHHEVVLFPASSVRAQDELVRLILLGVIGDHVWEPLHCQGGPLQGVRHDDVIEERAVLLPDLQARNES